MVSNSKRRREFSNSRKLISRLDLTRVQHTAKCGNEARIASADTGTDLGSYECVESQHRLFERHRPTV